MVNRDFDKLRVLTWDLRNDSFHSSVTLRSVWFDFGECKTILEC